MNRDGFAESMEPAKFFNKLGDSKVQCFLCPHNCVISPGGTGICRVRKNINGNLCSLNYGKITSMALDPIEKKPLYRFRNGSQILSVGTFGCNFNCSYCQNWAIAHANPKTYDMEPKQLVDRALELRSGGNIGIAYTYNEPSIWYEFVYDTTVMAKEVGLSNVLVTNGFIEIEPFKKLLPYIDAINIDIKSYDKLFYTDICGGELEKVKKIVEIAAKDCHLEVTTLIIPTLNDKPDEIFEMSKWLSSISRKIPLHITRFFPGYKMMDILPTPKDILIRAQREALKHLDYVYIGNV